MEREWNMFFVFLMTLLVQFYGINERLSYANNINLKWFFIKIHFLFSFCAYDFFVEKTDSILHKYWKHNLASLNFSHIMEKLLGESEWDKKTEKNSVVAKSKKGFLVYVCFKTLLMSISTRTDKTWNLVGKQDENFFLLFCLKMSANYVHLL
jgi:hypothetical protein